ncbi:MAG: SUMF1/EgtB/PvdO family nonheme iron enzyme [Pseudomonadota bacterium]
MRSSPSRGQGLPARRYRGWSSNSLAIVPRWGSGICLLWGLAWTPLAAEPVFVDLPGGRFTMGDPLGEPDEAPVEVEVAPYRLMRLEVTNRQFADFVAVSGHVTDAERHGFGWTWSGRWQRHADADWRKPFAGSAGQDGPDHPVVQVSANDAAAFCAFYGWRLPTEQEWEFAARGTDGRRYPWGNVDPEAGQHANFGTVACCAPDATDGHLRTAPVGSFPSGVTPFGLLDMAGNVWEWTSTPHFSRPDWVSLRGGGWGNNPWCLRTTYRHGNPRDIGLDMVGFRCAADPA